MMLIQVCRAFSIAIVHRCVGLDMSAKNEQRKSELANRNIRSQRGARS